MLLELSPSANRYQWTHRQLLSFAEKRSCCHPSTWGWTEEQPLTEHPQVACIDRFDHRLRLWGLAFASISTSCWFPFSRHGAYCSNWNCETKTGHGSHWNSPPSLDTQSDIQISCNNTAIEPFPPVVHTSTKIELHLAAPDDKANDSDDHKTNSLIAEETYFSFGLHWRFGHPNRTSLGFPAEPCLAMVSKCALLYHSVGMTPCHIVIHRNTCNVFPQNPGTRRVIPTYLTNDPKTD